LEVIQNRSLSCQEESSKLKIAYAKSKRQLQRNWSINQAKRLLDKEDGAKGKQVTIEWKVGNDKSLRRVKVGEDIAFQQYSDDLSGSFMSAFSHLSLE